jgi:hypothetical protein
MRVWKQILKGNVIQSEMHWSTQGTRIDDPDFNELKDTILNVFPSETFDISGVVWGVTLPQATYMPDTITAYQCNVISPEYPAGMLTHPNIDTVNSVSKHWHLDTGTVSYTYWWQTQTFGHELLDDVPLDLNILWIGLEIDESYNETGEVIIGVQGDLTRINDYIVTKGATPLDIPVEHVTNDSSINLHFDETTGELLHVMPMIKVKAFSVKGVSHVVNHSWISDYAINANNSSLTRVTKDRRGNILGREGLARKPKSYKLVKQGNGFVRRFTW